MTIHPEEIAVLLNLCPICPDIQYKILMLVIGMNGTPSSNSVKPTIIYMCKYMRIKFAYPEKTLTCYCTPLSLFNFMRNYYEELGYDIYDNETEEVILPEFLYEIDIAYTLYHSDMKNQINNTNIKLKESTKIRLNKMIASEPII